ncbi:MAG: glycosyltransferase family 9 protein [Bacteroidota bacterium]
MKDPIQKRIELWFRRLLIQLLGRLFQRKNTLQSNIDFNTCKFLFIRQDRIGDVLISTPLFGILKKHYPRAILDVLLSERNHFVLENDPLIHTRWMYRKKIGRIISLIRALRNERYDFVIDLMDNPSTTSTVLCLLINAKWNVGIDKDNRFVYDIIVPMLSRRETHIIDRIAQLLIPFHIDPRGENFSVRYSTSFESEEFVNHFLRHNNMFSHPIIGINISAGSDVRFWGVENFKGLLNHLRNMYPEYKSMLLYQPSDERRAHMIAESHQSVVLSPVTSSFDQFAAFVKRLSFLVTPDTAAVHLASAFKVGTVVLYVQSNKALCIWEPYGTDYECIVTDADDLSMIPVTQVQDALERLIRRSRKKAEIGV